MATATISDIAWKGYAMRGHRYRVTIEHLGTPRDGMAKQADLVFEAETRDEVIALVQRLRTGGACSADEATAIGSLLGAVKQHDCEVETA